MPPEALPPQIPSSGSSSRDNTPCAHEHAPGNCPARVAERSTAGPSLTLALSEHVLGDGFQSLLQVCHEVVCIRPIHDPVIERDGEVRAGAYSDGVFAV